MPFIPFTKKDFVDPTNHYKYIHTLYGTNIPHEIVKEVLMLYEECEGYKEEAIFYRIQYEKEIRKNGTGPFFKQER